MKTLRRIMAVGLVLSSCFAGFAQSSETMDMAKENKMKVMVQPRPFVKQDSPQIKKVSLIQESKTKSTNIRHSGVMNNSGRKESVVKAKVAKQD
jgi:hypothetical protein